MIHVYLVRHPETKRNINNKLTGWENTHYSKKGHAQFKSIVEFFKSKKKPIFSSDLSRAKRLGVAISKNNNMPICFSKNLREKNFKKTKPYDFSDTEEEFTKRVKKFFIQHNVKNMIVVSHAGTNIELKKFYKKFCPQEEMVLDRVTLLKIPKNLIKESNKKGKELIK